VCDSACRRDESDCDDISQVQRLKIPHITT